jgi:hypothetical protein
LCQRTSPGDIAGAVLRHLDLAALFGNEMFVVGGNPFIFGGTA